MIQFTQEELKNLLALLNRVDIKGSEALPAVLLMQKINSQISGEDKQNEKQTKEEEKKK